MKNEKTKIGADEILNEIKNLSEAVKISASFIVIGLTFKAL